MPGGNLPVPMTTEGLADFLSQLAEEVRRGNSLEGSVEYLLPGHVHLRGHLGASAPGVVMVRAAVRTGNLGGQGGMTLIGRGEN